jgi:hypothetical protein
MSTISWVRSSRDVVGKDFNYGERNLLDGYEFLF